MSKPKFHIAIKNELSSETLELYFLDAIYNTVQFDWFTGTIEETNMVEEVINQVKSYNPTRIKLIIDSVGGQCDIGLAIYNFLKNYPAKVETDNVGMACSIAAILMQSASKGKRMVARNSMMMIHEASGIGAGTSKELRQYADLVDKYTDQGFDVLAANNTKGKTVDDIKTLTANGDYWMTGQEAVDLGFADDVYNSNTNIQVAARLKETGYNNIPANLLEDDTPQNFFNSLKTELMEIVNTIKATFKKTKEDAPTTLPAITNAADIIGVIETALTPTFQEIETSISNMEGRLLSPEQVTAFEGLKAELQTANGTIKTLEENIAALMGGEANPKHEITNGPKPIGAFIK